MIRNSITSITLLQIRLFQTLIGNLPVGIPDHMLKAFIYILFTLHSNCVNRHSYTYFEKKLRVQKTNNIIEVTQQVKTEVFSFFFFFNYSIICYSAEVIGAFLVAQLVKNSPAMQETAT